MRLLYIRAAPTVAHPSSPSQEYQAFDQRAFLSFLCTYIRLPVKRAETGILAPKQIWRSGHRESGEDPGPAESRDPQLTARGPDADKTDSGCFWKLHPG